MLFLFVGLLANYIAVRYCISVADARKISKCFDTTFDKMKQHAISIFRRKQRHLAIVLFEELQSDLVLSGGIQTAEILEKNNKIRSHEALVLDPCKFFPLTFYDLQN